MSWLFDNSGASLAKYGDGTVLETSAWSSVGNYGSNGYVYDTGGNFLGRIAGDIIFDENENRVGRCQNGDIYDASDFIVGSYDGDDEGGGAAALILLLN